MAYLVQLRTFLEAYRLGSITRAAASLGITQPAASSHIRVLEAQLKKKLFIRHARGIDPTAIAQDLARSIGSHIENIEIGFNAVRARAASVAGTIHLAGPGEFLSERVVPAIASLVAHDIRVRIHTGGKEKIYALLDEGAIDLAVTASQPQSRALGYEEIEQETFVLVATPTWIRHHLTQPLDPAQLLTQALIAYDEELPLVRQYFDQVFGIQLNAQATVSVGDLRMVRALLLAGQGYSVLPHYLCQTHLQTGAIALIDTPSNPPTNRLYLVWNRSVLRHPRVVFARDCLLAELKNGSLARCPPN